MKFNDVGEQGLPLNKGKYWIIFEDSSGQKRTKQVRYLGKNKGFERVDNGEIIPENNVKSWINVLNRSHPSNNSAMKWG